MELELPTANSLQRKYDALRASLVQIQNVSSELQDQLRELLSHCESQAQHSGYALEESAYTDVAGKLRGILDGE